MATISFGETDIGDICSHVNVEVHRLTEPPLQGGLGRETAMQTDPSPNVYYLLRCQVHYKGGGMLQVGEWIAGLGELLKAGLQTVTVTEGSDSLSMDEAALLGPIAPREPGDSNAALVRGLELRFRSTSPPEMAEEE